MSENKNNVRLGDGVANNVKETANQAVIDIAKEFINIFTDFAKEKAKDAPEKIGEWLNSKKVQDELVELWSNKLFQDGLISKGYAGLPEELLISNFRQEGYLDGMYVGYVVAIMGLVDNNANEDLILSVRDYIRPNLIGHHYDDREEIINKYNDEKYFWIEKKRKSHRG